MQLMEHKWLSFQDSIELTWEQNSAFVTFLKYKPSHKALVRNVSFLSIISWGDWEDIHYLSHRNNLLTITHYNHIHLTVLPEDTSPSFPFSLFCLQEYQTFSSSLLHLCLQGSCWFQHILPTFCLSNCTSAICFSLSNQSHNVFPSLHNPIINYISTYKSSSNTFCPIYYLIEPFPWRLLLTITLT